MARPRIRPPTARTRLAIARNFGIATVKLDATSQGQPLYESFGFTPEQGVERWERPGISVFSGSVQSYSLAVDQAAYGYSRADLLESLGGARGDDKADRYALTRPGAIRPYLGPCIAPNPEIARQLLTPVLALDAMPRQMVLALGERLVAMVERGLS